MYFFEKNKKDIVWIVVRYFFVAINLYKHEGYILSTHRKDHFLIFEDDL